MNESVSVMRLEVDGRWSAREFGHLLLDITDLYNLRLVLEALREDWRDLDETWHEFLDFPPLRRRWRKRGGPIPPALLFGTYPWTPSLPTDSTDLVRLAAVVYPEQTLEVRRLRYESPGIADVAGIGVIVGHVKDFILQIIEHRSRRRQRDIENTRAEAEVTAMRIENARKLVSLAEQCGYDRTELRKLIGFVDERQELVIELVDKAKLTSVRLLDRDESSSDAGG